MPKPSIVEQIEHAESVRSSGTYPDAMVQELVESVNAMVPLGSNGFIDSVAWSTFRRIGQHRDAEECTTLTNRIRAALSAIARHH